MRSLIPALGLLTSAALGGCQMLDSRWLDTDPVNAGTTCQTNAGTYHLPRRLITVKITGTVPPFGLTVEKAGPYVADRTETYCLDFLLSYLSADRVGIQRTSDGLLQRVYTQADDKTKGIAQDVIQAAADLVASNRAETLSGARSSKVQVGTKNDQGGITYTDIIAQFEFDPFVEREAREVNSALREFGYCVYLDARNDPFVPAWSQELCRDMANPRPRKPYGEPQYRGPVVYKADPAFPRSGLPIFDPRPVPQEVQAQGILYRPELSHSLVVLRKPDPGSRHSGWRMAASDRITVPNAAPAFVLRVERAIFVKAETDVQFSSGLIKTISINKPSELLAASDLAVAAAQIVTNIPAQTLKILNNRVDNTIALINTNEQLITLLRQYKDDVNLKSLDLSPATAQALGNTGLILPGRDPRQARLEACLADPAVKATADPMTTCLDILSKGL